MAEDKNKKKIALDLRSLATGGTQEAEHQDEQLDEVSGGGTMGLISDINKRKYQ